MRAANDNSSGASVQILAGDCRDVLKTLPDQSVQCVVTSPPYFGLRDYGVAGQMGLEDTPSEFVAGMVGVFREVRRVLRDDGTLWLNLGYSYAANRGYQVEQTKGGPKHGPAQAVSGRGQRADDYGLKPKNLIGIPWRVALALQADGWYLRQDIIWHKPNPMPESVRDRCTKAHEYIFMLSKSPRYYYDGDAVKEPAVDPTIGKWTDKWADKQRGHDRRHAGFNGRYASALAVNGVPTHRNRRSVWTVSTKPFKGSHFATFPPDLIEPCILAGCPAGGVVLDPFFGAGTTGLVAQRLGRNAIGIELNTEYAAMARARIDAPPKAAKPKRKASNDNTRQTDLFGAA